MVTFDPPHGVRELILCTPRNLQALKPVLDKHSGLVVTCTALVTAVDTLGISPASSWL
jgi:hypothetical protein